MIEKESYGREEGKNDREKKKMVERKEWKYKRNYSREEAKEQQRKKVMVERKETTIEREEKKDGREKEMEI